MKAFPLLYRKKEECCGCAACYSVCPTEAISMGIDEEGFSYPIVNKELCIKCYQCIAVCPVKQEKSHI